MLRGKARLTGEFGWHQRSSRACCTTDSATLHTSPGWSLWTETPFQGKLQDLLLQVPHCEGEPNIKGHNCWLKLGNFFLESQAPRQGTEKSFEGSVVTKAKGWDKRCRACYPNHRTKQTKRLEGKLFLVVQSWKMVEAEFSIIQAEFSWLTHSDLLRSWRRHLWTRAGPRTGNLLKLAHWLSQTEKIWGLKSVIAPSSFPVICWFNKLTIPVLI